MAIELRNFSSAIFYHLGDAALNSKTGPEFRKYLTELTAEEQEIADQIELDEEAVIEGEHDLYLSNGPLILALMAALQARSALPKFWTSYWTDASCNPGRAKLSREGIFARNGCKDDEAFTHPSFVKHLRFLLLGCDLPPEVGSAFARKAGKPEWVSSRDAIDLGKFARQLARENDIAAHRAAEEFLKLALQLGFAVGPCVVLHDAVKQMR